MLKLRTASKRSFQPLAGIGGLGFSPALANKKNGRDKTRSVSFALSSRNVPLLFGSLSSISSNLETQRTDTPPSQIGKEQDSPHPVG